jgi:hypothetical protein
MALRRAFIGTAASLTLAVAVAVPRAGAASPACPLPRFGPGTEYRPHISPGTFSADVDNPWFPLRPGRTYVYAGTKDGKAALDVVVPSARTKEIDGVRTRVVEDRLFLDGVLEERTSDYYAQDTCGNVWYFGEDTAELDAHGNVADTSGSFHAGVDGAQPGVFMQRHPQLGRRFRQEWYAGEAEDTFSAVDLAAHVTVPLGHFDGGLRTRETTVLEPGVVDTKVYVRGIGEVVERSVAGPKEELRLVDVVA